MSKRERTIEKFDWIFAIIVIFIAFIYLFQYREAVYIIGGGIVTLFGIALLNKGNRSYVNLKTDVKYIVVLFTILVTIFFIGFQYAFTNQLIVLAIIIIVMIMVLYR